MSVYSRVWYLSFVCLGGTFNLILGGLPVVKKCGEVTCSVHEFCSQFDKLCKPCVGVCNPDRHNYQPDRCEKDCQDYLHDVHFQRNNETTDNSPDMKTKDIELLKKQLHQLTIAVSLMCFVTILLFLLVTTKMVHKFIWKWKKKLKEMQSAKKSKEAAVSLNVLRLQEEQQRHSLPARLSNNNSMLQVPPAVRERHQDVPKLGEDQRNTQWVPSSLAHRTPKRQPSESTVPEHAMPDYAYDNPALSPSPTQTQESNNAFRSI